MNQKPRPSTLTPWLKQGGWVAKMCLRRMEKSEWMWGWGYRKSLDEGSRSWDHYMFRSVPPPPRGPSPPLQLCAVLELGLLGLPRTMPWSKELGCSAGCLAKASQARSEAPRRRAEADLQRVSPPSCQSPRTIWPVSSRSPGPWLLKNLRCRGLLRKLYFTFQ